MFLNDLFFYQKILRHLNFRNYFYIINGRRQHCLFMTNYLSLQNIITIFSYKTRHIISIRCNGISQLSFAIATKVFVSVLSSHIFISGICINTLKGIGKQECCIKHKIKHILEMKNVIL